MCCNYNRILGFIPKGKKPKGNSIVSGSKFPNLSFKFFKQFFIIYTRRLPDVIKDFSLVLSSSLSKNSLASSRNFTWNLGSNISFSAKIIVSCIGYKYFDKIFLIIWSRVGLKHNYCWISPSGMNIFILYI